MLDFFTVAVTDNALGNTSFPNVYVHPRAYTCICIYTNIKHGGKLLHVQHIAGRQLADADVGEYLL